MVERDQIMLMTKYTVQLNSHVGKLGGLMIYLEGYNNAASTAFYESRTFVIARY